jgi:hypothetical protein
MMFKSQYVGMTPREYMDGISPDNDPDSSKADRINYADKKFLFNKYIQMMEITDTELRIQNSNERLGPALPDSHREYVLERKKPPLERPPKVPTEEDARLLAKQMEQYRPCTVP